MTTTGLATLEKAIHSASEWLKAVEEEMGLQGENSRHRAYQALRATLHALRDRLTPDEAADLAAQLPLLIRGIYYESYKPSRTPDKELRSRNEFLERIWSEVNRDPQINPDRAAKATMRVLSRNISEGEIRDVRQMLPDDLAEYWP
jgi:uncharacterized protein (DUF2267 family)